MVLRNGAVVESYDTVPPRSELVRAMLGDTLQSIQALAEEAPFAHTGEPVLQTENLSVYADLAQRRPRAQDISLQVYPGEIVGLYGLVGAGRTELARALFGMWPGPVTGRCMIAGREGRPRARPKPCDEACRFWWRTGSRRVCCTGKPSRTI